jgi:hypothetical protein
MASDLLHLLPSPGWLLCPQHVCWCCCRKLPQMQSRAREGREGQKSSQKGQEDRREEAKYVLLLLVFSFFNLLQISSLLSFSLMWMKIDSNGITRQVSGEHNHYCLTDLSVDSNDITALVSVQESKNIIFTCRYSKNHSWPSPLVIFSVPTRENNVFLLSFHRIVILHYFHLWGLQKSHGPGRDFFR